VSVEKRRRKKERRRERTSTEASEKGDVQNFAVTVAVYVGER